MHVLPQLTALAAYDNERPRSSSAITSRTGLTRGLRVERLVKKHQEKNEPLPSLLYMVTSHLATRESTRTSPITVWVILAIGRWARLTKSERSRPG